MRHCLAIAVAACASLVSAAPASAGVYSDDLGKCLVSSTTELDKTVLVQWIFSAISANPALAEESSLNSAGRAALTRKAAALFMRLLTDDCRRQAIAALKFEGQPALASAFNILGSAAVQEMMAQPAVVAQLQGLGKSVDVASLQALFKEAGLTPPDPKP